MVILGSFKEMSECVFKTVEQARYLSEKNNKDLCHYLEMALRRGWIGNWIRFLARDNTISVMRGEETLYLDELKDFVTKRTP